MVETLNPEGPWTVVADGSRVRNWAKLNRVRPALGAAAINGLTAVLRACRESGESIEDISSVNRAERLRIVCVPIVGAYGSVHGVHLWAAPEMAEMPEHRKIFAWEWDAVSSLAHHGPGIETEILGVCESQQRDTRAPTDFFRRVVNFDQRMSYFAFVARLNNGESWDGQLTVQREDKEARQLHMLARAYVDGESRLIRGLVHDITDVSAPEFGIAITELRALAKASRDPVGLIALDYFAVYEWLSSPVGLLARWVEEVPEFHPDDLPVLATAFEAVGGIEDNVVVDVRLRFDGSNWISVNAVISGLAAHGRQLGLIRIISADQLA